MKKKRETCPPLPLWTEGMGMLFDPMGSYTGTPKESDELPVQDVDDL